MHRLADLSEDMIRIVYRKYASIRNSIEMDIAAQKVAMIVSDYLVHAVLSTGQYAYYSPQMCHLLNFFGNVKIYGIGRLITLRFCDRTLTLILKIKPKDGIYIITDYDYDTTDVFAIKMIFFLIEHFNTRFVIVNKRRPTKGWIQFHLRDKIIEDLAAETNISVYRLEKILDS